jgi:hypothetical protein
VATTRTVRERAQLNIDIRSFLTMHTKPSEDDVSGETVFIACRTWIANQEAQVVPTYDEFINAIRLSRIPFVRLGYTSESGLLLCRELVDW